MTTNESRPGLFRAGHAAGPWETALTGCLEQIGDTAEATLGFLYASDELGGALPMILARLRDATGIAHWVGTVGMGICAGRQEYFAEPALAVMTAELPEDAFHVVGPLCAADDAPSSTTMQWAAAARPRLGLVHGDPRNPAVPELIADLAERTAGFLVGGLSSSRDEMPQVADVIAEGGVSGVLFAGDLDLVTGLTQGCTPVGPVRTITAAQNEVLLTLDGRPALEVLREDMAGLARDRAAADHSVHVALPVPGSDTGDYLVRNLIGVDPASGAVAIAALADPGDRLVFCRRDPESAALDLRRMLRDLRGQLDGPPRGGIYVSCLARGPNLFGPGSRELGAIADELGEFPLVGFFANGEISGTRLYGYTGVLTLFR